MMLPLLLILAFIGRVAQAGIEIPRYLRSLIHVFLWNIALFTKKMFAYICLYFGSRDNCRWLTAPDWNTVLKCDGNEV